MARGFILLSMSFALGVATAPKFEKLQNISREEIDHKVRTRLAKLTGLDSNRYFHPENRVDKKLEELQEAAPAPAPQQRQIAIQEPAQVQVEPPPPYRAPTLSVASHGILATFEEGCLQRDPHACLQLALRAKEPQLIQSATNELRQNCDQSPKLLSVHSCEKLAAFYEGTPIQSMRDLEQAYALYTRACAMAMQLDQQESRARSWIVCVTAREMAKQRNGEFQDRRSIQSASRNQSQQQNQFRQNQARQKSYAYYGSR